MSTSRYFSIPGGHPPQTELLTGRAVFTEAYAVIPRGVMQDIVTSYLPFWDKTRRLGDRAAAVRLCRDVLAIHHGGRARAAAATGRSPMPAPKACCSSSKAS